MIRAASARHEEARSRTMGAVARRTGARCSSSSRLSEPEGGSAQVDALGAEPPRRRGDRLERLDRVPGRRAVAPVRPGETLLAVIPPTSRNCTPARGPATLARHELPCRGRRRRLARKEDAHPVHQRLPRPARAHRPRGRAGVAAGHHLRRVVGVPGAQGRAHRLGVDPHRGALDHHLPLLRQGHHPREQHRADGGLGGRVDRRGRRLHAALAAAHGLRAGERQGAGDLAPRRPARRADDDPAAARPHRRGARQAHLPGGHRLRRRAHRRRDGRHQRQDGALGLRARLRLQAPRGPAQALQHDAGHALRLLAGAPASAGSCRRRCSASATSSGRAPPRR